MLDIVERYGLISAFTGERFNQFTPLPRNGWSKLIDQLCDCLVRHGWDRQVYTIESRCGGLRFTAKTTDDALLILIHSAEYKSYDVCESCGSGGTQDVKYNKTMICSLCEHCRMNSFINIGINKVA